MQLTRLPSSASRSKRMRRALMKNNYFKYRDSSLADLARALLSKRNNPVRIQNGKKSRERNDNQNERAVNCQRCQLTILDDRFESISQHIVEVDIWAIYEYSSIMLQCVFFIAVSCLCWPNGLSAFCCDVMSCWNETLVAEILEMFKIQKKVFL